MAKWTPEQKQKALAIAEATSAREAAKKTGIPLSTIGRWMGEQKRNGTEHLERNGTSKKVKQIAEEATEEAKAEVREFVADRAKQVANDILGMVQQALAEAEAVIQNGPNDDEPKAAWLRAVIGAMAQGVEKHQLMTGKPTNRQALEGQVTNRYEYDITQRIVSDPESRETARDLFRRAISLDLGN